MATAFMSEPSVSYNLLLDVYSDFEETRRMGNKSMAMRLHGRKLARTTFVYTLSSAISALVGALWDVWRTPEEDEEYAEQLLTTTWENFLSDVVPFGKLPILKDIYSSFQGWDIQRMDTEVFAQAVSTYNQLMKLLEGEADMYKLTYSAVKTASYATGLPGASLMREVVAMWNNTVGNMYESLKVK